MKVAMGLEELEQFDLLEEKIGALISLVNGLKEEKNNLEEKVRRQEEAIASFSREKELIKADRALMRKKIETILEKIETCNW